ncbi:lipase [Enterococcus plantarum]|uniref:coiled-coil domain-containing protein n=1 Tax=Enterococcus plantarum TaxID=1077675 RepID=UPI00084D79DC|nr:CHAP domain-containing protein [Enterococcus plantarum]MBO0466122.1 CHAP domain-containing protein [Enterococcus plantarum]OEG17515.1 lipase [Enterococcus plantarum]
MKKSIISALMVCSVTLTSAVLPMAAVADDYDTKIEQQNEIINGLKTQESEAATKLAAIESDMLTTATKIDELTAKRKKLKTEITKLYGEISDLNVRIQKREVQMRNQARDVQVSGTSTSYLDVIINSESISDAISRVQGITTLVNANNDLLEQQTSDKEDVEKKTKTVESQISVLETSAKELNEKQASLNTLKIEQEIAKNELEAQRSTEENKKSEYVEQKAAAQKKLKEEQAKQAKQAEAQRKAEAEAAKKLAEAQAANPGLARTNVVEENGTTTEAPTIPVSEKTSENTGGSSIGTGKVSEAKKRAAQIALNAVGQTNPTGWGQSGECIVAVQNWLNAAGIRFTPGGPHSGYTQSGAVQVSWSDVQVGDVVQYENALSPDAWLDGVHTVLVVGVNGSSVQIVESNNPAGSGYVSTTTGWTPSPYAANFRAVVWRFPG